MLDRPVVARLAGEMGYPEVPEWIEEHRREYAEGVVLAGSRSLGKIRREGGIG